MTIVRDLRGYGHSRPDIVWPNGARVAVSLVVNFEEGAELAVEQGDAETERYGEVASTVAPGVRDLVQEQVFDYGMRVGLWRFLDAFAEHKVSSTFMMCGRAVERVPDLARAVVEAGHEPAVHGWRWRPHADFTDAQTERASIQRCIDVTESATGVRPVGFFCRGSQSAFTRDLLIDLGFEYDSNAMDDDLPYWARGASGRSILAVPYAFDTNDMKFYHPNGFVTQDEFVAYVRNAIDALLEEGRRGVPKMLTISYHLRISGRPARIGALTRVLGYLESLGDAVWVARRRDIARYWRSQFPL